MDIMREFSDNGKTLKLFLTGDLTFEKNLNFTNSYLDAPAGIDKVVVDFRKVKYMDSSALGLLLLMKNYCQERGVTEFHLVNCNEAITGILQVSEFNQIFSIS